MKTLKWLDENFEEVMLVGMLVIMSFIMGGQIVARYVLRSPLTWSEELVRFLFVWSGFLSISYCLKKQISIKIEQLVDLLPKRINAFIKILEKLIMLVFYVYMVQFAYTYFANAIASGQLSPAMQIPMYLVQVSPLVGFLLAIFRLIEGLVEKTRVLVKGES